MDKCYIGDELFIVDGPEQFAEILKQKLGDEAAELFKEYLEAEEFDEESCPGECDKIYDLQHEYESGIQDALDALGEVEVTGEGNRLHLRKAIRILEGLS